MKPLKHLAKRFLTTSLNTVQDTTDVSVWQTLMRDRCKTLPTKVILGYAYIHVVFNQQHLLKAMVKEKALTFRSPWVDWEKLNKIASRAKANKQATRSSNYYPATLRKTTSQSGHQQAITNKEQVTRDVLACKLVGFNAIPTAVCDLYDDKPSRDLWKAMLQQWQTQVHNICTGAMSHYYMKCSLDRWFAVRKIDHGTISWWPTQCPSYKAWYKELYDASKDLHEDDHFQILCAIYRKLNATRACTFTDALAQTCWSMKEVRAGVDSFT